MVSDPFAAAGTLRDTYAGVDWATTSVGPVSYWSATLLAAVDLTLHTRAPVTLLWGPELELIYNEAYAPMIGDKHPSALGAPARTVFAEIWDTIGPMLASVRGGGGATWVEDLPLLMDRRGFLEETSFTFSYSPVHEPGGEVEGVIDIAAETTTQVLGRRRLELLSRLNDRLGDVGGPQDLIDRALPVLRDAPDDLSDVAIVQASASRSAVVLRGRDFALEDTPGGAVAHTRLPALAEAGDDMVLSARLSLHLAVDDDYLGFVRLIGAALAQGINRARMRQAELRLGAVERELAEALQRSLLAPPLQGAGLEIAVRYQPAAEMTRIGGDWYDTFRLTDGTLTIVVGDVTGHDRHAAAGMAQIRNLLRGISYTLQKPPARVLSGLDAAMSGLSVDVLATVLITQIDTDDAGVRTLRWSNAGHPPPALLAADGTVRLLDRRPETMLGTRAHVRRSDHTIVLEPGDSVVLYTDGLVERRCLEIDDGLAKLTSVLAGQQHRTAEQLCDHLLEQFPDATQDDVVLTVLRAGPLT